MRKTAYAILITLVALTLQFCGTTKTAAEWEQDRVNVEKKINSKRFTFETNYVVPSGKFQPRYLTTTYDLTVTPDTLTSYLPYFGVTYDAPFSPSESPLIFTGTNFHYEKYFNQKQLHWVINIVVKNRNHTVYYTLTIWENGSGELSVLNTSRQRITFRGELK